MMGERKYTDQELAKAYKSKIEEFKKEAEGIFTKEELVDEIKKKVEQFRRKDYPWEEDDLQSFMKDIDKFVEKAEKSQDVDVVESAWRALNRLWGYRLKKNGWMSEHEVIDLAETKWYTERVLKRSRMLLDMPEFLDLLDSIPLEINGEEIVVNKENMDPDDKMDQLMIERFYISLDDAKIMESFMDEEYEEFDEFLGRLL